MHTSKDRLPRVTANLQCFNPGRERLVIRSAHPWVVRDNHRLWLGGLELDLILLGTRPWVVQRLFLLLLVFRPLGCRFTGVVQVLGLQNVDSGAAPPPAPAATARTDGRIPVPPVGHLRSHLGHVGAREKADRGEAQEPHADQANEARPAVFGVEADDRQVVFLGENLAGVADAAGADRSDTVRWVAPRVLGFEGGGGAADDGCV